VADTFNADGGTALDCGRSHAHQEPAGARQNAVDDVQSAVCQLSLPFLENRSAAERSLFRAGNGRCYLIDSVRFSYHFSHFFRPNSGTLMEHDLEHVQFTEPKLFSLSTTLR
jgi:hypothetical protein